MTIINNGYNASFENFTDPGVTSYVDFNLITPQGTIGDQGAFLSRPGQTNTYFFATGYKAWAELCLYSRDNKFAPFCTSRS